MTIKYIRLTPPKKAINSDIIIKGMAIALPMLVLTLDAFAAAPTTGMAKLDQGGWKLVGIFQSAIFWLSMLYTFRSLLEVTIRGEGSWKKVGTGFLLCVMDYLIPFLFSVVKGAFA